MTMLPMWDGRSLCLISVALGFLLLVSAFSVLLTDEAISSLWASFGASVAAVLSAQRYVNLQQIHPPRDDPLCLSRTQQSLYRSPSKNTPIPTPLQEAWHNYTQLHQSCHHPNWTEFFLSKDLQEAPQHRSCKYLVYLEGREGLGNGLLSLTSAFAFALASRRVLLIDSRKNLAKLLCQPFLGSNWILPDNFPYDALQSSPSLGPFLRGQSNSSIVSLNLQHTLNDQDQQIFCEEPYITLMNVKWVAWTSNQYFLTNFLLVPSFWQSLEPILRDHLGHFFTHLSRLLFLPANDTWAIILREYWSYLFSARSKLGVQVRLHGRHNLAEFDTAANEKIMQCLVENDLLPSFSSMENTTELSSLYGRKWQDGQEDKAADVAVLVASLQGRYSQTMKDQFALLPNKGTKMVRVHSVSSMGSENKGFHQAQLAMVEMWLLSFCDNLATSAFSTFGYIAQGLGDLYPYILTLRKSDNEKEEGMSACIMGQSVEPCTHYPRQPRCLVSNAKLTEAHKAWIKAHLRHCQDHERGWQLVDGLEHQGGLPVALDFL